MFLAVWILYAADRLLDTRMLDGTERFAPSPAELEARHFFHHRHRRLFLVAMLAASIALAALIPALAAAAVPLYLVEGGLLVGWFGVVHWMRRPRWLPKELAVGLFFAAAIFTPTLAREPWLLRGVLPAAALFAGVCALNCFYIHAWEREPRRWRRGAARGRLGLAAMILAACGLAVPCLYTSCPRVLSCACVLAALLLALLDWMRGRLAPTHLRAAADLVLLTPLLTLPFLR